MPRVMLFSYEVIFNRVRFLIVEIDESVEALIEGAITEIPPVVEILERPPQMDKGKGVVVSESPKCVEYVGKTDVAEVARQFVHRKVRRTGQSSFASDDFVVEVLTKLEGLDPLFRPKALEASLVRGQNRDFARLGIELRRATRCRMSSIQSPFSLMTQRLGVVY